MNDLGLTPRRIEDHSQKIYDVILKHELQSVCNSFNLTMEDEQLEAYMNEPFINRIVKARAAKLMIEILEACNEHPKVPLSIH
jgi:hypothetical protein